MPRGVNPRDEALLQARLWTPANDRGRLGAWYRFSAPNGLSFSGSNVSGARDFAGYNDLSTAGSTTLPAAAGLGIMARFRMPLYSQGAGNYAFLSAAIAGPLATATKIQIVGLCYTSAASGTQALATVRAYNADNVGWGSPFADMCARRNDAFLTGYNNQVNIGSSANTWFIWSQQFGINGFVHEVFRDDALTATSSSSRGSDISAGGTRLRVGHGEGASDVEGLGGQVAELVITVNGDNDLRRRCAGHIAWAHGMQHLLPAGHPFRNAPPLI